MGTKHVLATFVYSTGPKVQHIFKSEKDAAWFAHMEGDHLLSWSTQEIDD